jgi:AcrR family transcriptional regulator
LEPQQAQSRESLRRLLQAAAEVLGQHGLAGTTIPRIANHAGLTPGAVYRRFKNKDVLLETMILRLLEDQEKDLRQSITPELGRTARIFCALIEVFYAIHQEVERSVRSAFFTSAKPTHFTLQYNASCCAQLSVQFPYEVASPRGETSNQLFETLEEWNVTLSTMHPPPKCRRHDMCLGASDSQSAK